MKFIFFPVPVSCERTGEGIHTEVLNRLSNDDYKMVDWNNGSETGAGEDDDTQLADHQIWKEKPRVDADQFLHGYLLCTYHKTLEEYFKIKCYPTSPPGPFLTI